MVTRPLFRSMKRTKPTIKVTLPESDEETASLTSHGGSSSSLLDDALLTQSQRARVAKAVRNKRLIKQLAMRFSFGVNPEELVQRESRSDRRSFQRDSLDFCSFDLSERSNLDVVYDWDMSLFHEPPSIKGTNNLKSCIKTGRSSSKSVHWPSDDDNLFEVTCVVGYDRLMLPSCFYNREDFEGFRFDKFVEENPDEFEFVDGDDEEFEEIIEEEIVYYEEEYYEEEIIEEEIDVSKCPLPIKKPPMMKMRITSV